MKKGEEEEGNKVRERRGRGKRYILHRPPFPSTKTK